MKTSTIIIVLVLVLLAGGGFWYWSNSQDTLPPVGVAPVPGSPDVDSHTPGGPNQAAGTNGSPNQGNMGQPDNGTPQHPGDTAQGDGSTPAENLTLGINVDAKLGSFLSAYNGMTLYTYAKDKTGTTTCYGACATNWPPYTVNATSDLHLSAAIHGKLGTITRADGVLQVTYNGMPLYFFKTDKKVGDTTGQNVGGVWVVAKS